MGGTQLRNFLTVWRRELGACFLSPVAYVTMVVFVAVANLTFLKAVEANVGTGERLSSMLFASITFWLTIVITVICMRLFAEEKRSGTIESLLTAPVTEGQVVMGKYAGALSFVIVVVLPAVASVFVLMAFSAEVGLEDVDPGALCTGLLFLLLSSAFSVSLGLLASLMTRNQIIAAICCFGAVWLVLLFGYLTPFLPAGRVREIAEQLSAIKHLDAFSRGVLDTRPVVLYVTGTAFTLFCAVRFLESRRWR